MATTLNWLPMGYNFGCMIANDTLFDSRGRLSRSSCPMQTADFGVVRDIAVATVFGFLYIGCTLASPGECDWTVHVHWRCGLMSYYFDHLFSFIMNVLLCVLLGAVETTQHRLTEAHKKAERYKVCIVFIVLQSISWQKSQSCRRYSWPTAMFLLHLCKSKEASWTLWSVYMV